MATNLPIDPLLGRKKFQMNIDTDTIATFDYTSVPDEKRYIQEIGFHADYPDGWISLLNNCYNTLDQFGMMSDANGVIGLATYYNYFTPFQNMNMLKSDYAGYFPFQTSSREITIGQVKRMRIYYDSVYQNSTFQIRIKFLNDNNIATYTGVTDGTTLKWHNLYFFNKTVEWIEFPEYGNIYEIWISPYDDEYSPGLMTKIEARFKKYIYFLCNGKQAGKKDGDWTNKFFASLYIESGLTHVDFNVTLKNALNVSYDIPVTDNQREIPGSWSASGVNGEIGSFSFIAVSPLTTITEKSTMTITAYDNMDNPYIIEVSVCPWYDVTNISNYYSLDAVYDGTWRTDTYFGTNKNNMTLIMGLDRYGKLQNDWVIGYRPEQVRITYNTISPDIKVGLEVDYVAFDTTGGWNNLYTNSYSVYWCDSGKAYPLDTYTTTQVNSNGSKVYLPLYAFRFYCDDSNVNITKIELSPPPAKREWLDVTTPSRWSFNDNFPISGWDNTNKYYSIDGSDASLELVASSSPFGLWNQRMTRVEITVSHNYDISLVNLDNFQIVLYNTMLDGTDERSSLPWLFETYWLDNGIANQKVISINVGPHQLFDNANRKLSRIIFTNNNIQSLNVNSIRVFKEV